MENQGFLGLYISRDRACAALLSGQGKDKKLIGCFEAAVEYDHDTSQAANFAAVAEKIAAECKQQNFKFAEVGVAVDSSFYMQHDIHSEFTEPKQIAQTIRFDTEETLANDVSDMAIAFRIKTSSEKGSNLSVLTAAKKILNDILTALQAKGLDPVTIEPDSNCLAKFFNNFSAATPRNRMLAALSSTNAYLFVFAGENRPIVTRSFPLNDQNRDQLIQREVPITLALSDTEQPIESVELFDSAQQLSSTAANFGIESGPIPAFELITSDPKTETITDKTALAIACGAAMTHLEKEPHINFRNDFSPFMGKRLRMERTLKIASVSVCVAIILLSGYLHWQLFHKKEPLRRLEKQFIKDYSDVMMGAKFDKPGNAVKKLQGELRRIKEVKSGQLSITGEQAIAAKLTRLLEAFNKCAKKTNLNVREISISAKSIRVDGDTSGRPYTLELLEAIRAVGFDVVPQRLASEGGRDIFAATVTIKGEQK
ncbi:MAG: type II secretion system protein GspL [Phycisphaerae bacterium]|nr:type II secretion system protein GspL [Phycisphaerae bacterium]